MKRLLFALFALSSTAAAQPPFPVYDGPLYGNYDAPQGGSQWDRAASFQRYLDARAAEARVDTAIKESNWILNGPDVLPPQSDSLGQTTNDAFSQVLRQYMLNKSLQRQR